MLTSVRTMRRALAPFLAAATLLSTAVVPLLDRYVDAETVIAAAGEHADSPAAHDHSICIQVSANQGLLARPAAAPCPTVETAGHALPPLREVTDRDPTRNYLSRAPPLV